MFSRCLLALPRKSLRFSTRIRETLRFCIVIMAQANSAKQALRKRAVAKFTSDGKEALLSVFSELSDEKLDRLVSGELRSIDGFSSVQVDYVRSVLKGDDSATQTAAKASSADVFAASAAKPVAPVSSLSGLEVKPTSQQRAVPSQQVDVAQILASLSALPAAVASLSSAMQAIGSRMAET